MNRRQMIWGGTALTALAGASPAMAAHFPEDAQLLARIKARVDEGRAKGLILGVLEADGTRRIAAYGDPGPGARPLGAYSVVEIGSITKVFTGILLADMAQKGEVEITAPAQRYAPAGMTLPSRGGRQITLEDLATHRSGLPRLPSNFAPANPANPYADYTPDLLKAYLASYELPRDPGAGYEYSNLGMGLLGYILAHRAGADYETLVRRRVLAPLGMSMSGITLSAEMRANLVSGHGAGGRPVPLWDLATLAGAGGLRSTMQDMLAFLQAQLGEPQNDLQRAMREAHRVRASRGGQGIGLAWTTIDLGEASIVAHDGGTGGFSTMIAFDPGKRIGAVMFANSVSGANDIAMNLVNPAIPLTPAPARLTRPAIELPAATLGRFAGEYRYDVMPAAAVTLAVEGGGLRVRYPGVDDKLVPASETVFFSRDQDVEVTFTVGEAGAVSGFTLRQLGMTLQARKVR